MMAEQITHPGIIVSINDSIVKVKILSVSACSSCHAKQMCNMAEVQEKIIEIPEPISHNFQEGEEIIVGTSASNSMPAVFFAYILPAILLMGILFTSIHFFQSETMAALLSIGGIILYYGILYLFKNKFSKKFQFTIALKN